MSASLGLQAVAQTVAAHRSAAIAAVGRPRLFDAEGEAVLTVEAVAQLEAAVSQQPSIEGARPAILEARGAPDQNRSAQADRAVKAGGLADVHADAEVAALAGANGEAKRAQLRRARREQELLPRRVGQTKHHGEARL